MGRMIDGNLVELMEAFESKVSGGMSKSDVFVEMYKEGFSISEIGRISGSVYSFVYGVIDRKVGINRVGKGNKKSDRIRSLYDDGMEVSEIVKWFFKNGEYINSSYVWNVVNKYRNK